MTAERMLPHGGIQRLARGVYLGWRWDEAEQRVNWWVDAKGGKLLDLVEGSRACGLRHAPKVAARQAARKLDALIDHLRLAERGCGKLL